MRSPSRISIVRPKKPFVSNRWALRDRRRIMLGGVAISVAPPEYVIIRKLEFFREGGSSKHVHDIRGILRHQAGKLDMKTIEAKVAELGLVDEWRQVGEAPD
jgi:hypothetical protein